MTNEFPGLIHEVPVTATTTRELSRGERAPRTNQENEEMPT